MGNRHRKIDSTNRVGPVSRVLSVTEGCSYKGKIFLDEKSCRESVLASGFLCIRSRWEIFFGCVFKRLFELNIFVIMMRGDPKSANNSTGEEVVNLF